MGAVNCFETGGLSMRYAINFDKLINRYVPYYIGGRKLILYLQAIMKPLQSLNDSFVDYAKETRIEATMTSQIFKFEWYLNRKFKKYFVNDGEIAIKNTEYLGTPIYYGNASIPLSEHFLTYYNSENVNGSSLYNQHEKTDNSHTSFVVTSPAIDTTLISEQQYEKMLRYCIDKYRLCGKTYTIKYISNE